MVACVRVVIFDYDLHNSTASNPLNHSSSKAIKASSGVSPNPAMPSCKSSPYRAQNWFPSTKTLGLINTLGGCISCLPHLPLKLAVLTACVNHPVTTPRCTSSKMETLRSTDCAIAPLRPYRYRCLLNKCGIRKLSLAHLA